jgi:hypothetical protein
MRDKVQQYYWLKDRSPKFVAVDTSFGAMYGAYRPAGPGEIYWRIAQFLMPCFVHIPFQGDFDARIWVPMDDTHTMYFNVRRRADNPRWDAAANRFIIWPIIQLEEKNSNGWYGRFNMLQNQENDYWIDREAQHGGWSYSGIPGIWAQDHAVTESMGPIQDRTDENLGAADMMIARVRNRLVNAAEALDKEGVAPPGVDEPEVYRTRSVMATLAEGADWIDATAERRQVPAALGPRPSRGDPGRDPSHLIR